NRLAIALRVGCAEAYLRSHLSICEGASLVLRPEGGNRFAIVSGSGSGLRCAASPLGPHQCVDSRPAELSLSPDGERDLLEGPPVGRQRSRLAESTAW